MSESAPLRDIEACFVGIRRKAHQDRSTMRHRHATLRKKTGVDGNPAPEGLDRRLEPALHDAKANMHLF
jgi:hypothetical protein